MQEPDQDLSFVDLLAWCFRFLDAHPDALLFVKWTCEGCGDRATSNEPNAIHLLGYEHAACGSISHPKKFGVVAAISRARTVGFPSNN